jgi:uncharacterized membrane protein YfcA
MIFDLTLLDAGWAILVGAAFFAGMVDAVVGGGGLIQVPVLLDQFPQASIPALFGTNKLSAITGTTAAMWKYCRAVPVAWRVVLPATVAALVGAGIGAALVAWLPREAMRPVVLVLMIAAAVHTFRNKNFGQTVTRDHGPGDGWRGAGLGLAIGFYDGFFGPGTGSLLLFAFVRWFGMDFLRATASAKVVNVATNLSAIAFFSSSSTLLWGTGAVMALCNLAGAHVGAVIALRHGSGLVRKVFLLVVLALIGKLAWDLARSWLPALS